MIKQLLKRFIFQLLAFFIIGFALTVNPLSVYAQMMLQDEHLPFIPREFYIKEVTDERAGKSILTQGINFQSSAAVTISNFITRNLSKDKSLRPICISLKELKLTEISLPDDRISGTLTFKCAFGLEKPYGTTHLIDYEGKSQYTRSKTNDAVTEKSFRTQVRASLNYFNTWITVNAPSSRKLASRVKVSFSDYTTQLEGDTIYYAANRPLTWTDFQAHIKPTTKYQAIVMPGIAYDQEAAINNGTIEVQITLKAFLPKSASWASAAVRDAYSLNHEQRHFDLAKITANQLQKQIMGQKLTPDNFEAVINMQYLDTLRELNTLQNSYDNETSHGTNTTAQSAWNAKIDRLLN